MKDRPVSLLSAEEVGIVWAGDLLGRAEGFFWHEGKLRVLYRDGAVWERREDTNSWKKIEVIT